MCSFSFCSIVKVRETRLTGFLSSTLIALSLLMLPIPLTLIPTPVLDGVFLFMAMTSLYGNQMFERALLLVTEQVGRNHTLLSQGCALTEFRCHRQVT